MNDYVTASSINKSEEEEDVTIRMLNATAATYEDYEYDVSESLEYYDWAELVPAVVVYSVVLLLGIFGNVLIIFTISRYRRLKTITNIFLASLSSADLLLVTICVPVNVAKLFSYTWTFGAFLCKFVHYMQNVSAICSVLTLTAMSIERYYAIVHPMKAQYLCTLSQARKVIIGIWIASFLLASPTVWIQIHLPVGQRVPAFWCVRDWENPLSWQLYEIYMLVLVLILPLSIMAGAYAAIAREIWRVTYLRSAMTNETATEATPAAPSSALLETAHVAAAETDGDNNVIDSEAGHQRSNNLQIEENSQRELSDDGTTKDHKSRPTPPPVSSSALQPSRRVQTDQRTAQQVVKMLVAVVVLFTVCWSPYLIDNVLMSFELLPGVRTGPAKHMRIAFHLLSYINSCCNPLVYGFMSRNFRRGFVSALKLHGNHPTHFLYYLFCCCLPRLCCSSFFQQRRSRNGSSRYHHSVYKFSATSHCSRVATQIRLQDPGYIRSSMVGGTTATCISAEVFTSPDSAV